MDGMPLGCRKRVRMNTLRVDGRTKLRLSSRTLTAGT